MTKMKKSLMLAIAAFMIITAFSACNVKTTTKKDETTTPTAKSPTEKTDTSWSDIKTKGTIIVGLDDQVPPMGFRDDANEIVGVDIDLAKAVAENLGVKVEFKPIDWKAKEMEIQTKKIDVIWNGFTITDERKNEMLFSQPYMDNSQAIVTKEGSDIKAKSDLAGKKIGVQGGSSAQDAMSKDSIYEKISKENISNYDTMPLALIDLASGRIDAVVADDVVVRYYIAKSTEKYVVLEDNFGQEEYGIGFRKEDVLFKTEVDKALKELKTNGTAAKISKKWFGESGADKIK